MYLLDLTPLLSSPGKPRHGVSNSSPYIVELV